MREFKFRIWDTVDNKWLFGYDYESLGGFSLLGEVVLFGEISSIPLGRLNDVRVMQFTGLKDKSGKEIYEGDIVRISDDDEQTDTEVYFYGGGLVVEWSNHFNMGESDITTVGWAQDEGLEFEVIGNIYQNPKLL